MGGLHDQLYPGPQALRSALNEALHLVVRPAEPATLFIHQDAMCLSKFQFTTVFRAHLHRAGLPARQFGSHSFWIGAATTTVAHGLGEADIKNIGR